MTDMIKADELVLKTDGRGRVQTPAARREQLLDEFERSGLSGKKFSALVGIKYQTLATWRQKRRLARGVGPAAEQSKGLRLVEAVVEENRGNKRPLVLELPGGARMEIKDARQMYPSGEAPLDRATAGIVRARGVMLRHLRWAWRRRSGCFGPGGRGQRFEFRGFCLGQALEDVPEIVGWIDAVPAATAQYRVDDRAALSGLRMADEQKVLFANRGGPNGVLAAVIVYPSGEAPLFKRFIGVVA